jgi:hypothetical protein
VSTNRGRGTHVVWSMVNWSHHHPSQSNTLHCQIEPGQGQWMSGLGDKSQVECGLARAHTCNDTSKRPGTFLFSYVRWRSVLLHCLGALYLPPLRNILHDDACMSVLEIEFYGWHSSTLEHRHNDTERWEEEEALFLYFTFSLYHLTSAKNDPLL